jgi:hypothetical protein
MLLRKTFISSLFICSITPIYAAETVTTLCWEAAVYDQDNDGYAQYSANKNDRVSVIYASMDASRYELNCPPGWVKARGDCNDQDASIHPRQAEFYANNLDDNCDGRVDEPTFSYSSVGFNTSNGFYLHTNINDAAIINQWNTYPDQLFYSIEYQKLTNTGTSTHTPKTKVASVSVYSSHAKTRLQLSQLSQATAYRSKVRFFKGEWRLVAGQWVREFSQLGDESPWYYTYTNAAAGMALTRTKIINTGLYQQDFSNRGFVGYRSAFALDGSYYGAEIGNNWCSEFYSWVAGKHLTDMPVFYNVPGAIAFFEQQSAYTIVNSPADFIGFAQPGDYLAMDTNSDGKKNHTVMFLAHDQSTGLIWTIEGNNSGKSDIGGSYESRRGGNEVVVHSTDPNQVKGWGRILNSML